MDSSATFWPYEEEMMEEEARLIHESEWQLEMMRPFDHPLLQHSSPSPTTLAFNSASSSSSISINNNSASCGKVISFGCSPPIQYPYHDQDLFYKVEDLKPKLEVVSDIDPVDLTPPPPPNKSAGNKSGVHLKNLQVQENVEAERKRREKLTQGFIHLSSLLPGLKKMDKVSVLAEAASYVKQLRAQVNNLEEQTTKRKMESVASVGKYRASSTEDRDTSSSFMSDETFGLSNPLGDHLPEVEARISDKDILIKVHCERKREIVARVLEEIQRLNLDMINYNAMDFGKHSMVITVLAKMNDEFSTTAKNLVKMLQQSLQAPL